MNTRPGGGGGSVIPVPTGVLMDGFETSNSWTNVNSTTLSIDAAYAVQGDYALKSATATNIFGPLISKTFNSFDMQTLGTYAVFVHLDEDYDFQNIDSLTFSAQLNATGTVYPGASRTVLALQQTGGMWLSGGLSQFNAAVGAAGVGNHAFRISSTSTNAIATEVEFDAFYRAVGGKASIILTFDDVKANQYTTAFPIMQARGLVGELYVPTALVGTAGCLTWAQIGEMRDAGWSIQVNGTADDGAMNIAADPAAAIAALDAQALELTSRGFDPPISFPYPFGAVRNNGTRVERTGVTTTAGSDLVPLSSTTGIMVGMRFIAYGVSRSCRVIAVTTDTSVQLSEVVTAAVASKNVSFVDDSPTMHGNKLQNALKATNWKWARTTANGSIFCQYGIARDHALLYPSFSTTSLTLSGFQAIVNPAIPAKATRSVYIHNIANSGGNNWTITEFTNSMDWLKTQIDAGLIFCATTPMLEQYYGGAYAPGEVTGPYAAPDGFHWEYVYSGEYRVLSGGLPVVALVAN